MSELKSARYGGFCGWEFAFGEKIGFEYSEHLVEEENKPRKPFGRVSPGRIYSI